MRNRQDKEVTTMAKMGEEEIHKAIRRRELEDTLRQECLGTINQRITRYLELNFTELTPNEPFASISAQCILLYRDGYFFACIALCQAVAEALVRFMCERSKFGASVSKNFEENVEKLRTRNIKPDCSKLLEEIWEGRPDYHHLNPKVPTEIIELQVIAKSKMIALHDIESKVFAFQQVGGAIKPRYPKYWPEAQDGLPNVFLRLDP
jgi:hypothetical protein